MKKTKKTTSNTPLKYLVKKFIGSNYVPSDKTFGLLSNMKQKFQSIYPYSGHLADSVLASWLLECGFKVDKSYIEYDGDGGIYRVGARNKRKKDKIDNDTFIEPTELW